MTNPISLKHQPVQGDLFTQCQRWRNGRASYRPAGEPFDPSRCEVRPIGFSQARAFITAHHYSASMPASRLQIGIFHKASMYQAEELAGVAVLSVPMQEKVIPAYFGGLNPRLGIELGRLALLDHLGGNAETWMLARTVKILRNTLPEVQGLLSFCDPVERTDENGVVKKRGHTGCIYRSFNGAFVGRSTPRTLWISRDGRCANERALSKIRTEEVGSDYAIRQLVEMGAPKRSFGEAGADYVTRALQEGGFKRLRHGGNLAFAWWLGNPKTRPIHLTASVR